MLSLQQHYSSQRAVSQYKVTLYVHKKRSCFDVSGWTSAVTAMKMFQDLFCICDDWRNGVKCLQCVAQKEYLFLACHHGHLHQPYPSHGEHMVKRWNTVNAFEANMQRLKHFLPELVIMLSSELLLEIRMKQNLLVAALCSAINQTNARVLSRKK